MSYKTAFYLEAFEAEEMKPIQVEDLDIGIDTFYHNSGFLAVEPQGIFNNLQAASEGFPKIIFKLRVVEEDLHNIYDCFICSGVLRKYSIFSKVDNQDFLKTVLRTKQKQLIKNNLMLE